MAIDRNVIEARVDEVLSANDSRSQQNTRNASAAQGSPFAGTAGSMPNIDPNNPFAAFQGAQGFGAGGPGASSLKLKLLAWLTRLATNPKFTRFLQKKWWPLWVVAGILLSGFIVLGGILFLIYKMVQAIISAYTDLFKK
ncbi:hypothetical protein [Rubritalea marina]|uniref:hypothetical protein n=1 Tax=Rubritalea marina TaxID=361055 RepID=UPI00037A095F|nr:hypothetical protein [Rubritalea marina]